MDWEGTSKDDTTWTKAQSTEDEPSAAASDESFLVARPEKKNPFSYIYNMLRAGNLAQTDATDNVKEQMNQTTSWQERLAMFLMQTFSFLRSPMATIGQILESTGNIIMANGGIAKTLFRLIWSCLFFFKKGTLVVPAQDSANYLTVIGLLDPRKDLLAMEPANSGRTSEHPEQSRKQSADHQQDDHKEDTVDTRNLNIFPGRTDGDRRIADLMLLASKFAYENEALVKDVVTNTWKMNFVGFYSCWNEYQQRFNTEVYIFTDKTHDANAIVVAWRGTAPFNADDWITDVDFSWYDLKGETGKVHIGFLECLGLGDRHDMNTFCELCKNAQAENPNSGDSGSTQISPSPPASGLPTDIIEDQDKILAYDDITKVVKGLLAENPNAKLFITGHSLGGALAMLYAGMLYYFGENSVANRIGSVYTFGQPRVGDETFAQFMLDNLTIERYFRVVYCNDIVPRLPFDDELFGFKRWGLCYFFRSIFAERTMKEEPNPNYFNVLDFFSVHMNAVLELAGSLVIGYMYGPTYDESLFSFLFRVLALFLPGLGDHSMVNYCNALRLGRPMPLQAKLN
ncbi:unnamed protein product [Calypogeia fissa]